MYNGEWYVVNLETLLIFSLAAPVRDAANESIYQENEMCIFAFIQLAREIMMLPAGCISKAEHYFEQRTNSRNVFNA